MGIFWKKISVNLECNCKNGEVADIYLEFERKRSLRYIFTNIDKTAIEYVRHCMIKYFKYYIDKKWIYEGGDTHRLIRDDRLETLNKYLNHAWGMNYQYATQLKIRNINIYTLI